MFKKLLAAMILLHSGISVSGPLTDWRTFVTANPNSSKIGQWSQLLVRGTGTNNFYLLEADPTTGALPVSGTFTLSNDTNWGTVGPNTLRTAAEVGNASGAADFGQGAVTAQTLRSVSILSNGTTGLTYGSGTTTSATPRVVLATDQTAIPASQSGTWTVQPGNTPNTTPWLTTVNQGGNSALVSAAGALKVDGSAVNQPVTQATSPWVDNVTQFGGSNIATGTGASGSGIPRVTVSNDSNVLATQSGSWSVTANAGTNLNTSALALDTSVNGILLSPGTSTTGQKGPLVQGAVTTAAPSYTTGQTDPLSLTLAGALRTDSSGTTQPISGTVTSNQGTTPWVNNITQFGGTNLSTGTGASGSGIPRITVSNDSNVLATQSGSWTVAQGSANTAANAWPIKLTDGTNVTAVKPASTASAAADPSAVVALSPNSPLPTGTNNLGSLTNITGTISLPTGAATDATLSNPQGSVSGGTAGTKSVLIGGQYNTSLPSLSSGNQAAIPLDQSSRVIISPLTNSSIVTANIKDSIGTSITLGQKAMTSSLPVVIASDQIPIYVLKYGGGFADSKYLDMSSTNVTTGAWVQLIASIAATFNYFKIVTTCGSTLELGTGGSGSETRVLLIPPGGYDSDINLRILSSTRISVRAVTSAGCTTGELNLTGFSS